MYANLIEVLVKASSDFGFSDTKPVASTEPYAAGSSSTFTQQPDA